jgi:hypothetical protein
VAAGTIYGASGAGAGVILQARAPTSLVVHGAGGAVYFARQMAVGEAWRAPTLDGLSVDVGVPAAVEVFVGGASRGALTQPKTSLAKLAEAKVAQPKPAGG